MPATAWVTSRFPPTEAPPANPKCWCLHQVPASESRYRLQWAATSDAPVASHGLDVDTTPRARRGFCRLGEPPPAPCSSRARPAPESALRQSLKKSCQAFNNTSRCSSTFALMRATSRTLKPCSIPVRLDRARTSPASNLARRAHGAVRPCHSKRRRTGTAPVRRTVGVTSYEFCHRPPRNVGTKNRLTFL